MVVSRAMPLGDRARCGRGSSRRRRTSPTRRSAGSGSSSRSARPQLALAGLVLGREELEGEGPLAGRDEVADAGRALAGPVTRVVRGAMRHSDRCGPAGARALSTRPAPTVGSRRDLAAASWDAAAFRAEVQSDARGVRRRAGARGSSRSADDAARLVDAARAAVSGGKRFRAAFCYWGFRAVRETSGADEPARWCGPPPRSSCCTPARWCTTTTWTPRTPGAGRPATHRAFEARPPGAGLARRPGAVRRRRRDPARRPAAVLVRRAAADLRPAARRGPRRAASSSTPPAAR